MKKILRYIYIIMITVILNISIVNAEVSGITLKKSETTLGIGYTETLKYELPAGLNSSNIVWKTSNPKVATVQNGKVTAISEGTTTIYALLNGYTSTCTVTVSSNYVAVTGISINKSNLNILVGNTENLTSTIQPSNATNKDVIWKSTNPEVATIENGKVTAKKVGKTNIIVSSSGYSATCIVNVVDTVNLEGITLNKTSINIKELESETLKIIYNPSNATNTKVTWKSSNQNIVTVDNNGKITAVKPGSATITVISNDGGHVSTCKVTVEALTKNVTNITLDKKELNIVAGEKATLKVTVNPSYAENKNVKWESSDEKIVTVENGEILALKKGTAEIKVISEDGNKEAICVVNVSSPPITGISFKEKEKTVYIGSTEILSTINEPTNSELESAIWTSSNETVATVENGKIKTLSLGETIITVSNEDNTITASINIKVIDKPKEKLKIEIEGYNLNFAPEKTTYELEIGKEEKLNIIANTKKIVIKGNQKLKDGSVITITVNDEEKQTYIIHIKKKSNYTIYFIAAISFLLLINLIRILISSKKKKNQGRNF